MYNEMYGLGAVSLRYFNVFGPKQSPTNQYAAAVPIFINNALKNKPLTIYGDGEQTRDFIFVKDVVNANVLAATSPDVNGVFNVGQGTVTSIKKLAEEIIEAAASRSNIVFEKERAGDIKHSFASINETIDKLKFEPRCSLKEGLIQTIDYFKASN
jgi:UDP-glucose 4-epimerase